MDRINEKEFEIINQLALNNLSSQRELSRRAGISLGMTNVILKRLARKGYLKIKQLNRKKVQYMLTPKGFAEKTKKSYRYLLKTIHLFEEAKRKIQNLVFSEKQKGNNKFLILGNGELADLVEIAIKELKSDNLIYARVNNGEDIKEGDSVILVINGKLPKRCITRCINIIHHLADIRF